MSAPDIRSFEAAIDRMIGKVKADGTAVFRGTCNVVTENIVAGGQYGPGTPVDTGFARDSWTPGLNGEGAYRQPSEHAHGAAPAGEDPSVVGGIVGELNLGDIYYCTSNCAYQRALDYGHSGQAPNGHVRLVMDQLPAIVAEQVREHAA